MNPAVKRRATKTATVQPNADLRARCEHALGLLLTHRGNPAVEIERVLAEDPQCVLGHCLRAAIIVRADTIAARSTLAASVAAIEAACPDIDDPPAVTPPQRVLGLRPTRLLRSNGTAPLSSIGLVTFSRSWSRMHSTSAWDGDA
jgi:hypothetical protein